MDSSSETDFLVYADGVWRSVELRSGRVQGWARRARFAVLCGGALRLLQRARVLRALRDLRDGKESCVRAGRELQRVHRRSRDRRRRRRTTRDHRSPPSPLKPTQPPTNPPIKPSIPLKPAPPIASPPTVPIKSSPITAPVKPVSKSMVQSPKPIEETERVKKPVRAASPAESTGSTDGVCELEVSESTVTALRGFLAKHAHSPNTPPALRGADVRRFDRDEEYRRSVLFRVQPLVRLVRCAHVARLLRDGKRLVDVRPGGATLAHFTSQLGLQRRPRARPRPRVLQETSSSSDYSLQKLRDELKSPERRAVIGREERAPRPPRPAPPRPPSPKTIRGTQGRDYSSLEDQCIVCWVSAGPEREHAVKGNRLWRELEEHFPRLSGHARTYHSLRNRYLRYLLPGLARLAVPLEQARRMRAAAATGNIKYRETLRGAPPAAPAPPPAGAWARRPRPRAASPTPPPQPRPSPDTETTTGRRRSARLTPQPPLPSPPPPAAPQPPGPRPESPLSYAEVTRRFARKHHKTSTPASSPASGSSVSAPEPPAPPRTRRLYNPR